MTKKVENRTVKRKLNLRSFDAAKLDRLNASWTSFMRNINDDIRFELSILRARSNDLAQNDPLAKKYLTLVEENIVGPNGFYLQSKAQDSLGLDIQANAAIEKAYKEWCDKFCDVSGRLSFSEIQRLISKSVARDGEILVRHIIDDSNKFGYQVQLISADRLADINKEFDGNSKIISGVEFDKFGRRLKYHLYEDKCLPGAKAITIPASEITHIFVQDYPEQVRGIPWMASSMTRMNILKKYIEFALVASAIGASTMGFYKTPDGDGSPLADDLDEESDEEAELYSEVTAGKFGILPPGVDFEKFDPNYPHQMFDEFTKTISRWISSGLNVSYNLLCNDLEGVSFSSIRSSVLEERNHWTSLQNTFINQMMIPIYEKWLTTALLKNAILLPNGSPLPALKKDKFLNYNFLGRRWDWVDPRNDAEAKVVLIRNKLASPYSIVSEMGGDLEKILDDLQRFELECKKRNLNPDTVLGNVEENISNKTDTEKVNQKDDKQASEVSVSAEGANNLKSNK